MGSIILEPLSSQLSVPPYVHRAEVLLRPILDMPNSPHHPTAKWLAKLSEPLF